MCIPSSKPPKTPPPPAPPPPEPELDTAEKRDPDKSRSAANAAGTSALRIKRDIADSAGGGTSGLQIKG